MASAGTSVPPPAAAAPPPPPPPPASTAGKGIPSKIYNALIGRVDKVVPDKLRPLWQHPAGRLRTINNGSE